MINEKAVNLFKMNGFIHLKNFFSEQEVNNFLKCIEKKSWFIKNEKIDRSVDIEELWEFICHEKMLKVIRSLIGDNISFLHTASIMSDSIDPEKNDHTWHRDNPCRRTGYGPDWNTKEKYNVVSSMVYLTESDSILNVIKKSHFINFRHSISNILRTIDLNIRKFKKLKFLKNIIRKIIGTDIHYKSGDLVVFYANLYHARSFSKNIKNTHRSALLSRYGDTSMHSKTYLNYEMHYRAGLEKYKISQKKNIFFQKLKDSNIYTSPEIIKQSIDAIFVPSDKSSDSIFHDKKD
jgi:hypothetical protein